MSSFCDWDAQNCNYGCCDINGRCPFSSRNCSFYYKTTSVTTISTLPVGSIVGIAMGVFVVLAVTLGLIYWKRRQAMMAAMVANGNGQLVDGQTTIIVPNQNSAIVQPISYGSPSPLGQPIYPGGTSDAYGQQIAYNPGAYNSNTACMSPMPFVNPGAPQPMYDPYHQQPQAIVINTPGAW